MCSEASISREDRPTAIGLATLMKFKGIGRRAALRIVSEARPDLSYSTLRDAYLIWAKDTRDNPLGLGEIERAWDRTEQEFERGMEAGIIAISFHDDRYPERLRDTPDPPAVLFVKGDLSALSAPSSVAVVGTREPTEYGEEVAKRAGRSAAARGITVVSGLAHGCDTRAHEGCVEAKGVGVAVLAHGLDRVYPAANRSLASALLDCGGCLVSEYPAGVTPARAAFAERDRIQSGLSDGVFVVETDEQGGTMHTVRFARAQHRKIACTAHPNRMLGYAKTRGNQKLIRDHWAEAISDGAALSAFFDALGAPDSQPKKTSPTIERENQHSFDF